MNKRIKELWEQCKTPDWHQDKPTYDHEKFAELIVRECAELSVRSQYADTKSGYYEGFNEASLYVGNKIKQHFGVEE